MLNSKSVGNKIAEARKKINLSQAELAHEVSISAQAVGKWERGESMPDISTLNRLAQIFHVNLNYFSEDFFSEKSKAKDAEPIDNLTTELAEPKQRKKSIWNWDMSKGNWVDADFSGLKNLQEKFSSSNMKNCKFLGSELSGLILKSNNIVNCVFTGSDLRNSKIHSSHLSKNNFEDCSLIDTEFAESEINNCNFSKANFSGAEFSSLHFSKNVVERATWKFTSFKHSHLADIVFDGVMEDCSFDNCSFTKVTFKDAKLRNLFFKCKSLKRIQFVNCKVDRMTYEFLKNGKANLAGLEIIS